MKPFTVPVEDVPETLPDRRSFVCNPDPPERRSLTLEATSTIGLRYRPHALRRNQSRSRAERSVLDPDEAEHRLTDLDLVTLA